MKKFISTVLALGMAASLAACGSSAAATPASTANAVSTESAAAADTDLAYIQGKGKMTIGYTVYEPMNYTDADGNFTGFDTELATAVCEKLGVSRSSWRSTGTPRRPSWLQRASTASGTA